MASERRRRRRRARLAGSGRLAEPRALKPTPQRLARAAGDVDTERVEVDGVAVTVPRMADGAPLDRLYRRGVVGPRQRDAGARFWSDWYHAGTIQRTTASYSDSPWTRGERSGMAVTERQVHARQRLRAARGALGPHLGRVAEAMLIDELDPVDAGRRLFGRRDGPQARASATDALLIALDTLADHYGL